MKWWVQHTNKIKYCSTAKFYEQNNKLGKIWSPGSTLMNGTNIYALKTLKLISHTTPSSNMIYLGQQYVFHQRVFPLVLFLDDVSIKTCLISPSKQTISHGTEIPLQ